MEHSDLVLRIVFDLDNTFCNLSFKECRNIFHIFPSYRYLKRNINICESFNKYLVIHMYTELCEYLMEKYVECYLGYESKEDFIDKHYVNIDFILRHITNDEIKDCFDRLIIAEYKELFYENYNNYELKALEIFVDYCYPVSSDTSNKQDIIYNHKHDPDHYMFKNETLYTFYEYEKQGLNIFD